MGFLELKDGDWITITLRDGTEFREQWCEEAVLVLEDGTPYFHHYIYEPDGCTDLIPWDRVASIKLADPPRTETASP